MWPATLQNKAQHLAKKTWSYVLPQLTHVKLQSYISRSQRQLRIGKAELRKENFANAEDLQDVVAVVRAANQDVRESSQGLVFHAHSFVGILDEPVRTETEQTFMLQTVTNAVLMQVSISLCVSESCLDSRPLLRRAARWLVVDASPRPATDVQLQLV